MGKRTSRGWQTLIHLCGDQHCKSRLRYYVDNVHNTINISDNNYVDLNGTSASPTLSPPAEGKSTIPTMNPFCDTSNDATGNGGEAECRGQKRTEHFSQSCVASLLPVCSANLDTESYRCRRRFIIFMERRQRLASFRSMACQHEVVSG